MNEQPQLGKLISETAFRDAVHIAIAPVMAGEDLQPGQHVGVADTKQGEWLAVASGEPVGVVDPFLKDTVKKGERFYLLIYPGTISCLRHAWQHAAFKPSPRQEAGRE